jgi:hypothetical protein
MRTHIFTPICALLLSTFVAQSHLHAQRADRRIWQQNTRDVSMLSGNVWMQAPINNVEQNGNSLLWPSIRGFRPNINALYDAYNAPIRDYRTDSIPILTGLGFKIIRDRIIYDRIWELESINVGTGLRYYQKVYEVEVGVIVVTATARANRWQHPSVTQMIRSMQSLMVYY